MRAVVLREAGCLELTERPVPDCPEDTLLLRLDACAVCELDVQAFKGQNDAVQPPVVLGHELVGTVVEVGSSVHGHYDSERVTVAGAVPCGSCRFCRRGQPTACDRPITVGGTWDGGFAEYMLLPPGAVWQGVVHKVPDGVPPAAAALTEPLARCLNVQEMLRVGPGDTVLIIGTGAFQTLNVLLARALGVSRVFTLGEEAAAAAGRATVRLPGGSAEELREQLLAETDGRGADVVIVTTGAQKTASEAVTLAAPRGRIGFAAHLAGAGPALSVPTDRLRQRQLTIVGSRGATPHQHWRALSLIAAGAVDAEQIVTARFPLQEAQDAFEAAERPDARRVLIEPHENH
ncbi:MAG: alcohol dehydrogenase catalytic domain-containing protein [Candidatus Brocadiia bacterium]